MTFYQQLAKKFPDLKIKLRQAAIFDEPEVYMKKTVSTALMFSFGLSMVLFTFFPSILALLFIPVFFPFMFLYFMKYVDVKIERIRRKMDQEIIFAGRYLIIELESGVPIHKVFEDIEMNYKYIGFYFGEILNKVYLGTSMEDAINDTIIDSPSSNLRRILWQVLNSLKTGTEVSTALNSIIDQMVREQTIAVQEYGKKLNPLAMFYMMIAIILPSLGITMLVIMATFIGINISLPFFITIAGFIGLIQFLFLSLIRSSRPPISM